MLSTSTKQYRREKFFGLFRRVDYFDLLGLVIVLSASIGLGYWSKPLGASWLFKGQHNFFTGLPLLGIFATISAVGSILSTRFIAKQKDLGNTISWMNVILAGFVDFLNGNVGAVLTYPISMLTNWLPTKTWAKHSQVGHIRTVYLILMVTASVLFSFGINALAFQFSGWGLDAMYWFSSITFALAFAADVLNIFRIKEQWYLWSFYNVANLGKAIIQGNIANVGKYSYYIINSLVAIITWTFKRERKEATQ
ncbi:nicotinamide mononucleotide transporter [Eupransor demetentiae]|uniref:Nicotinamide riboside transporter PnuC (PnuC) n=1 Tax=Eupransor demetentiae TaxID=3109584 RepID=A0ABM9N4R4_9LACO|nr:Nicotinamide riboside transporter PnuC (PnuC) [Lactobacillaceae bacterium LMG 33000]